MSFYLKWEELNDLHISDFSMNQWTVILSFMMKWDTKNEKKKQHELQ